MVTIVIGDTDIYYTMNNYRDYCPLNCSNKKTLNMIIMSCQLNGKINNISIESSFIYEIIIADSVVIYCFQYNYHDY